MENIHFNMHGFFGDVVNAGGNCTDPEKTVSAVLYTCGI